MNKKSILFSAPSCAPCNNIKGRMSKEGILDTIDHVDVTEDPITARNYRVMSVPTLIVFDDVGDVLKILTGTKDIEKAVGL